MLLSFSGVTTRFLNLFLFLWHFKVVDLKLKVQFKLFKFFSVSYFGEPTEIVKLSVSLDSFYEPFELLRSKFFDLLNSIQS